MLVRSIFLLCGIFQFHDACVLFGYFHLLGLWFLQYHLEFRSMIIVLSFKLLFIVLVVVNAILFLSSWSLWHTLINQINGDYFLALTSEEFDLFVFWQIVFELCGVLCVTYSSKQWLGSDHAADSTVSSLESPNNDIDLVLVSSSSDFSRLES